MAVWGSQARGEVSKQLSRNRHAHRQDQKRDGVDDTIPLKIVDHHGSALMLDTITILCAAQWSVFKPIGLMRRYGSLRALRHFHFLAVQNKAHHGPKFRNLRGDLEVLPCTPRNRHKTGTNATDIFQFFCVFLVEKTLRLSINMMRRCRTLILPGWIRRLSRFKEDDQTR